MEPMMIDILFILALIVTVCVFVLVFIGLRIARRLKIVGDKMLVTERQKKIQSHKRSKNKK